MNLNRYVTLMIIPDGAEARRGIRMRQWHYRAILGGVGLLLLGTTGFYGGELVYRYGAGVKSPVAPPAGTTSPPSTSP